MEPMDISALFGNAVENAIESVEKIADPDRRLIHITVGREKSFLRIRVENCCDEKVIFKAGLPVTSKGDERYHGYGTRSIRSIVDKYKGSMTIKADDGWYRLRILFPLDT
jgi:sensor histidine kinase regulating citrate/malate metabolism